jgi:hypothetical protein
MKTIRCFLLCLLLAACCPAGQDIQSVIQQAAGEGKIAYKLTTPEDLAGIIGPPIREIQKKDGGTTVLTLSYASGVTARFTRMHETRTPGPFTLVFLKVNNKKIGLDQRVMLREPNDLEKINDFWGLAGVSLARVDLRDQKEKLDELPFDSRTIWPPQDRLPYRK